MNEMLCDSQLILFLCHKTHNKIYWKRMAYLWQPIPFILEMCPEYCYLLIFKNLQVRLKIHTSKMERYQAEHVILNFFTKKLLTWKSSVLKKQMHTSSNLFSNFWKCEEGFLAAKIQESTSCQEWNWKLRILSKRKSHKIEYFPFFFFFFSFSIGKLQLHSVGLKCQPQRRHSGQSSLAVYASCTLGISWVYFFHEASLCEILQKNKTATTATNKTGTNI